MWCCLGAQTRHALRHQGDGVTSEAGAQATRTSFFFGSPMNLSTLRILSAVSLLLLGVQFGTAQPFTTNLTAASGYGFFPSYISGYSATCSASYFGVRYAFAMETYTPASTGTYQISWALPASSIATAYLYSSDPANSTATGCVNEYGSPGIPLIAFNSTLTSGTTYYIVILTQNNNQSGVVSVVSFAPSPSTTPAPTTAAPSTTPAATTESPTSTPAPTTEPATTPPDTTAPATTPPDTTQAPPTTSPHVTTPLPPTTAIATSHPLASTQAPATTAVVPSTPFVPVTTPAPATSAPLASTTPPPATGNVTVTLNMDFTPNPPLAGQPLTIFGDAVASSGPAPTGNVTIYVDGVPVATTPVVPAGSSGRRRMLQSPKSVFSVTITAPSTPGVHVIIAVFFPDSGSSTGGSTPVAAPVTVDVNIPPASASVSLALSSSSLLFPFCTKPLKAIASVNGTSGLPQPIGNVTLSISGDNFAAIGAPPIAGVIGTAQLAASTASFDLQATDPIKSVAEVLHGQDESAGTKLLPGSYQLTATYSGDAVYGPATGSARLTVGPKCSLTSLAISSSMV
ncbi:hypothetical protein COCOBI_04-5140 [Coccomyxa sp. Obi]|nr:hypothetical protein COCOBI_04-5140 [Coccomyxa sp. Obi]